MTDLVATSTRSWRARAIPQYLVAVGSDAAADGIFYMALGWVAVHAASPISAATVFAAGTIPQLVLTLLGGVVGDRVGLARAASVTLVLRLVVVLAFTALLVRPEWVSMFSLIAVSAAFGLVDALHMPAMGGIAGLLADEGEQASVQGMVAATMRASAVSATAAAGLLIGWWLPGPGWVMAILLVVSLSALYATRHRASDRLDVDPEAQEPQSSFAMLSAGLRAVRRDRAVLLALALFTLANFTATAPVSLGVALRSEAQGWASSSYGLVIAAFALGSAGGAMLTGKVARRVTNNLTAALWLLAAATVGLAVLAISNSPAGAGVGCLLTGLSLAPAAALLMGEIRERTDAAMMGRVSSIAMLAIFGLIPVGYVVLGSAGQWWGLSYAGWIMAGLLGLSVAVAVPVSRRLRPSLSQP